MTTSEQQAPTVFLSYSHDSPEHAARVLALADRLVADGIAVILDQYDPQPEHGWPLWMEKNLEAADFVLLICTEAYRRRVRGEEEPGKGLGVRWEGKLLYNHIYRNRPQGSRFIPILLEGSDPAHIPGPVQGHTHYHIQNFDFSDPGYEDLYRHLTGQPRTPRPDRGELKVLPSRPRGAPSNASDKLFATEADRRNRRALLGKVHHAWIEGVLKRSLWNQARLVLNMEEQPRNVVRPYDLARREAGKPDTPLPAGTPITKVYAEAQGALLILGQPGSGKTTLLLEVALELLDRADADASQQSPIPIVFSLSSWRREYKTLDSWMVMALNQEYDVPRKIGKAWVRAGAIVPLLDGLDEAPAADRAACVGAINVYRRIQGGLLPMVVCSRSAEYQAIPALRLHTAVEIQPLTHAEVDQYLKAGGKALAEIRALLREDNTIYELMDTPLMISIVTLTFAGQSAVKLKRSGTREERRERLFAAYVERMFERKGDSPRYPRAQTLLWLSWLAERMQKDLQLYLTERMQPDWLPKRWQSILVQYSTGCLFVMLAGTSMLWLSLYQSGDAFSSDVFTIGSVFVWFMFVVGVLAGHTSSIETVDRLTWSWRKLKGVHLVVHLAALFGALVVALLGGLGVALGIVLGIMVTVGDGPSYGGPSDVLGGVLFGALFGATGVAMVGPLVELLAQGFEVSISERYLRPNEGMNRSLRSAGLAGLFGALFGGLVGPLSVALGIALGALDVTLVDALYVTLFVASVVALVQALNYGGRSVIQHYTLRLLLWRAGAFPRDITSFLDYCADRILLQRVGGGWRFVHRLLQEHLARRFPSERPGVETPV